MTQQSIFFVGTQKEIAHHAAPMLDSELSRTYRLEIISPTGVLEKAVPGDLAVFFSEHFDRFRNACSELKKRNVATLYLIDGILEWRNAWENRADEPACPFAMRPVLSHKAACIGDSQMRVLESWGNCGKVELVGVPRFDKINPEPAFTGLDGEFRVLVMTAKCPGFTEKQIETTVASLRNLKDWFASNSCFRGRSVIPSWRLTGNLAELIEVENTLNDLSGEELLDDLRSVDAVITTPSTAILEAMLMEKPVALLDFHNAPKYVSAAWEINHECQFSEVISQLMNPPPARIQFQQQLLRDNLLCEGASVARLSELMSKMLESTGAQLVSGATQLSFEACMLAPVAQKSEWQQAAMFPDHDEFKQSDRVELQAELAHARREVDFLNRELTQLRSELGEAHRIFDQIQQHPIAGPIVRARQKMLDWFGSARHSLGNRP